MSNQNLETLEQKVVNKVDNKLNTTQQQVYNGNVKWFNNRLGYGFIKVVGECDRTGDDIFVHQTKISPTVSEYRTLRKGEYVSFEVCTDEKNTWQANNVTGIAGGPLLCDSMARPKKNDEKSTSLGENSN